MKELECWLSALDRPRKDTPSAEVKKCEGVKKEVKTEEAVLFQVWVLPSPPSHHQVVGASFPLTTLTTFAAIYLTSFPVARTSCANNLVANPKSSCLFCSGPTLIHLEVIPKDDTCLPTYLVRRTPTTYNLLDTHEHSRRNFQSFDNSHSFLLPKNNNSIASHCLNNQRP